MKDLSTLREMLMLTSTVAEIAKDELAEINKHYQSAKDAGRNQDRQPWMLVELELQPWNRTILDMWEQDEDELSYETRLAETALEELMQLVINRVRLLAEPDHMLGKGKFGHTETQKARKCETKVTTKDGVDLLNAVKYTHWRTSKSVTNQKALVDTQLREQALSGAGGQAPSEKVELKDILQAKEDYIQAVRAIHACRSEYFQLETQAKRNRLVDTARALATLKANKDQVCKKMLQMQRQQERKKGLKMNTKLSQKKAQKDCWYMKIKMFKTKEHWLKMKPAQRDCWTHAKLLKTKRIWLQMKAQTERRSQRR